MITTNLISLVALLEASTAVDQTPLTDQDRRHVIDAVTHHLREEYIDPDVGGIAASALEAAYLDGDFANNVDGEDYAKALGDALVRLTGDGHLNIEFSKTAIEATEQGASDFSTAEMERYYGAHLNFGIEKVERLDGNIGLLDLRVFAPIGMGGDTMAAALTTLAHMDGLIIDLRRNGGGHGDMADLVASYLVSEERRPLTGIYDRPTDTLTQSFTQAHVAGQRFGEAKPVYVLTSEKTFSAAEALAYNLQALGRAKIVGEVTGGGAHPFEYVPVHNHFVLWSVTARSVNPLTGSNWQGVGVQPDIPADSDRALEVALADMKRELGL